MKKIIIEQSNSDLYTAHSGLAIIGALINRHTGLGRRVDLEAPGNPSVSHADTVKTYLGLLAVGKSDFEAAAGVRHDQWFKEALDVRRVPSAETLRQRFDRNAAVFQKCVEEGSVEMVKNTDAPITAIKKTGHVPLDMDVFALDNSKTKKEGVSRTYQGFDGYAPIAAYLGREGWCVGIELRPGSQHSQEGFVAFLSGTIERARELTQKPLLVRLDSAHDAIGTLAALRGHKKTSFIVKWNPRKSDPIHWRDRAFAEAREVEEPRPGKKVAVFSARVEREYNGKTYRFRRVMRVTERTFEHSGQMLLTPRIELEGWWTSLELPDERVIALYEDRGLSEQFHSEFKTDLDVERLPSGKFATNALVLACAGFIYNALRIIGQAGLLGKDSPVRHPAKRRRARTVMQELIYLAARVIHTGRRLKLKFGSHCPGFEAFRGVYARFCPG